MKDLAKSPPIFVVGPVRSGSTFLRLMLDSHPQISNPGECDFLFDRVSDRGEFPDVMAYASWLSANRIFRAKGVAVDTGLPYGELMQSFLNQLRSEGAMLMMNVHRHFHRIPHVFPDARYIRLLRDPRDVARSCIGMGWVGHVYYGVDIWSDAEKSWQTLRKNIPADQYFDIRYEDLLNDVEGSLTAICRFLGLAYSDRMMDYTSNSTYGAPNKHLGYQWKRNYTKRELQLVEGKVGRQISGLGYELSGHDPRSPGLWEKVWLYFQNVNHRVLHQIKRYGVGLYLEHLLALRVGNQNWQYACQRRKNLIDVKHLK